MKVYFYNTADGDRCSSDQDGDDSGGGDSGQILDMFWRESQQDLLIDVNVGMWERNLEWSQGLELRH